MNIIFDNIIVNLQKASGISTVWKELIEHLQSEAYDQTVLDNYRQMYLPENLGSSTVRLAELVLSKLAK